MVTGGAGYIGSITTRRLLDVGHEVVVLDTLEKGHKSAVDARAILVTGDVGDKGLLDEVLPGIDAVMHLAGYIEVGESQSNPGRYFRNNVSAPLTMLEAMVRHDILALVFSSTAAVYGNPVTVPIDEKAELSPVNVYGASKLMFEQLLDWYELAHGLRSVRYRYFNVAGAWPGGVLGEAHEPESHLIPRILIAMASGQQEFEVFGSDYRTPDGTCVRDYIHVCDLAEAHLLGLEWVRKEGRSDVFNLGNGRGYSNLEVVATCAEVTGHQVNIVKGPRRPGDAAVLVASSDKVTRMLGWQPERSSLAQMIGDAWAWHRVRL